MQGQQEIIIIGGGAAGFFAAITYAEHYPGHRVTLLEKGHQVLSKVKVSGGGRCNVTNGCFDPNELATNYPRGAKALIGPFHRFCTGDTMAWYESRGVELKIEDDNRVFPVSNNSQTIINCLEEAVNTAGVEVRTNTGISGLRWLAAAQKWEVQAHRETLQADKVLVATGSSVQVWNMLRELGHTIEHPVPSLFTFNINDPRIEGLPGIAVPQATVKVQGTALEETGPLLITHWGVSGPAILRLSAWGARALHDLHYQFTIHINWISMPLEEVKEELAAQKAIHPNKKIENTALYELPQRLWKRLVTHAGIAQTPWAELSKSQLNTLAEALSNTTLKVHKKSTFKEEFVTCGGIRLDEVNFKTFESKLFPGLHFAGEVLDIDAITGGFNFQAAWTGGYIAGLAMGE